jgi:osmotically-inducible protein OsmY
VSVFRSALVLILCSPSIGLLQGCAGAVVVGGAAAAAVAVDRRTTGTLIEDQSIELKAYDAFANDPSLAQDTHLSVTSFNGWVLLTGQVPTEQQRVWAGKLVRSIEKVRRVYNEVEIAAPSSLKTRTSDSAITASVLAKLFAQTGFDSTRIKVVTENGTVHLMGLVTHSESDVAVNVARRVSGVKRVVKIFEYID